MAALGSIFVRIVSWCAICHPPGGHIRMPDSFTVHKMPTPPPFPAFELLGPATLRRSLLAGESVYRQGDPSLSVYAVEQGRIRVVGHTRVGQTVLLYRATAGQLFSEGALFSSSHGCEAIADLPSRLLVYPKAQLWEAMRLRPELTQAFMALLSYRINALKERVQMQNIAPARERVIEYLSGAVPPGERTAHFDRPFKEIADELSLTQETLYRILGQLEREGVISRTRRSITLRRSA